MAGTYKNFMRLLESWPLDKSKVGSDLGQHIRDRVKLTFAKGDATSQLNSEECNRYYLSLTRISSNYHGQIYKRTLTSTASGLSKEHCTFVLTPAVQKYLQEEGKGLFRRLYRKLKYKYL